MNKEEDHELQVIGAGWGRTGTTSLKAALETLGYPCYHMLECVEREHEEFWVKISNGQRLEFNEVFVQDDVKFTASMDFPASLYWRSLLQRYPNAKVILTVREAESWFRSYQDTILTVLPSSQHCLWVNRVGYSLGLPSQSFINMLRNAFERDGFCNQLDKGKERIIHTYNEHNASVLRDCPPHQLLVFDVREGWGPLCAFLDLPVPDKPFPHMNDSQAFQDSVKRHIVQVAISQLLLLGTLLVPCVSLYYLITM